MADTNQLSWFLLSGDESRNEVVQRFLTSDNNTKSLHVVFSHCSFPENLIAAITRLSWLRELYLPSHNSTRLKDEHLQVLIFCMSRLFIVTNPRARLHYHHKPFHIPYIQIHTFLLYLRISCRLLPVQRKHPIYGIAVWKRRASELPQFQFPYRLRAQ